MQPQIAAGLQRAIEAAVLRMAGDCAENVCLAGGLGFNALLVARWSEEGMCSCSRWPAMRERRSAGRSMPGTRCISRADRVAARTCALGPSYSPEEIKKVLENCKLRFRYLVTTDELVETR